MSQLYALSLLCKATALPGCLNNLVVPECPSLVRKLRCTANTQSLHVSYLHLSHALPSVAIWLADEPKELLDLFNEVAKAEVLKIFKDYKDTHERILVRITDLPVHDNLRELREVHLNALIKVSGVITRRTKVFPQLSVVYANCKQCGCLVGPIPVKEKETMRIASCPDCQSAGPFEVCVAIAMHILLLKDCFCCSPSLPMHPDGRAHLFSVANPFLSFIDQP